MKTILALWVAYAYHTHLVLEASNYMSFSFNTLKEEPFYISYGNEDDFHQGRINEQRQSLSNVYK